MKRKPITDKSLMLVKNGDIEIKPNLIKYESYSDIKLRKVPGARRIDATRGHSCKKKKPHNEEDETSEAEDKKEQ